jgi:D-alanyl-D-alanine carboxypeptidase
VSIETAFARVAMLQTWAAPPPVAAPAPPIATAAPAAGSFQATLAQAMAPAGSYPHLKGDLDANPELLARLEQLAAARGETWTVTSGLRTHEEQQRLWDGRGSNPFPVARPGTSLHESGNAADVTIGGRPIQDAVPHAALVAAGLSPLAGDAVHVELAR